MPQNKNDNIGGNRLLAALTPADTERLRPHLEEVRLDHHQVLYEPNAAITRAYFPHAGIISLMVPLATGPTIEAAIVGCDGMVGLPLIVHNNVSVSRAVVQASGRASAIANERLQRALVESASLRDLLGRYAHVFFVQVFQTVACNAVHSAEQRFARWLLTASGRNGHGSVPLTHEYIAEMLGVGRPTISLVARALQSAGLIDYRRGIITVANRRGLEKTACECYWTVRQAYQQFLPLTFK